MTACRVGMGQEHPDEVGFLVRMMNQERAVPGLAIAD